METVSPFYKVILFSHPLLLGQSGPVMQPEKSGEIRHVLAKFFRFTKSFEIRPVQNLVKVLFGFSKRELPTNSMSKFLGGARLGS